MPGTTHVAEVTDPITGETITLTASSADELEQLVDAHLAQTFPAPPDIQFEVGIGKQKPDGGVSGGGAEGRTEG